MADDQQFGGSMTTQTIQSWPAKTKTNKKKKGKHTHTHKNLKPQYFPTKVPELG